ncbi:MAG: hypothetical protein QM820_56505 [Minicystis sp.]
MSLPRSILLARPVVPATANDVRTVRAYGEPDDPVRILVILADHLRTRLPERRDAVDTCLDRRAAWRTRVGALRELLAAMKGFDAPYAALVDPDALAPASRPGWEDRTAHRMREDIRKAIFDSIDAGGWLVAQPQPTALVSEELDQIDLEPEKPTGEVEPEFAIFPPDVQMLARWLVTTRRLPREALEDIVEDAKDPGQHILRIAYDALPEGAREAGRRLHVTRVPSARNGMLGPFRWADTTPSGPLEVAARDVDVLEAAFILRADDARHPGDRLMARRVRKLFATHAAALESDLIQGLHQVLAKDADFERRTAEEQIEIHHHAARAGDLKRVRETALYFGFELRTLATQVSRVHQDYELAASLFHDLVEEYDKTDAYAWEYLGFNLALADKKSKKVGQRASRILEAYGKAHALDKKNPLYHGRYLGYRAERGYPVMDEVNAAMAKYAERSDAGDFVSWFAMPVLDSLFRGGRHADRKQILDAWGTLLEWSAPGVLEKHGAPEE